MKTVRGDLTEMALQGQFDVIVHGCNCFHTVGVGIAKAISSQFPEALAADKATGYGERSKLGTISTGLCCANQLMAEVPLSPDRLMPRLP